MSLESDGCHETQDDLLTRLHSAETERDAARARAEKADLACRVALEHVRALVSGATFAAERREAKLLAKIEALETLHDALVREAHEVVEADRRCLGKKTLQLDLTIGRLSLTLLKLDALLAPANERKEKSAK